MASQQRRKRSSNSPEQDFVENLFGGLGQVFSWLGRTLFVRQPAAKGLSFDAMAELQAQWLHVEGLLANPATWGAAVSEADKTLDHALKALGYAGTTMADRLRAAETRFTKDGYQEIWQAHKLRNALAHEVGARVGEQQAYQAVGSFRSALYQLQVLN